MPDTAALPYIRWMILRDMPEVLEIERSTVAPWSEEDYRRTLRERNCIGMVAERGQDVTGLMVYEMRKTKLHLLNFAVHPKHRRFGVGSAMVAKLISKLSAHRRPFLSVHVRESNLPAQLFFQAMGFRAIGVLRGHYDDTGEDGYCMQYRLQGW